MPVIHDMSRPLVASEQTSMPNVASATMKIAQGSKRSSPAKRL